MRIAVLTFGLTESTSRQRTFARMVDSGFMAHGERQYFVLNEREPGATPLECIRRIEYQLMQFDYVYILPIHCRIEREIGVEFLPTYANQLVVVQHPRYVNIPCNRLPYERDERSWASIQVGDGMYYMTAKVFGGSASAFCDMVHAVLQAAVHDRRNGIEPRRRFESYLNRYVIDRPHRMFHAGYSYPMNWDLGVPKHIEVPLTPNAWHQSALVTTAARVMSRAA